MERTPEPAKARTSKRGRKSLIDWPDAWRRYRDTPGIHLTDVAKQLGISGITLRSGLIRHYGAAYRAVAKIRHYSDRHRPITNEVDWPKALADYKAGTTHQKIADQYGCSEFSIRSGLRERYKEHREIARHRHGRGPADVDWAAVWTEVQAGAMAPQLAPKYHVSEATIRHQLQQRYGKAYNDRVRGNKWRGVPTLPGESKYEKTLRLPPEPRGTLIGKLYAGGATGEQLADLLGVRRGSIHSILARYPEYRDEQEHKRERVALVRELHDQGWTPKEIGEVIGHSNGEQIASWLEVRGLIPNTKRLVVKLKPVKPPKLKDRR